MSARLRTSYLTWLLLGYLPLPAQMPHLDPQVVLNRHAAFANEALHILWVLQPEVEALYQRAFLANHGVKGISLTFPAYRLLHQELYQGALLGICQRADNATDAQTNLRRMYLSIRQVDTHLDDSVLTRLTPPREGVFRSMMSLLHLCDSLATGTNPARLLHHVGRIAQLFQDVTRYTAQLQRTLIRYHHPIPESLLQLHKLVLEARHSASFIQKADSTGLRASQARLRAHIDHLAGFEAWLPQQSSLFPVREHRGYEYLLRYAEKIHRELERALHRWEMDSLQTRYTTLGRLLNHQYFGLVAYYNQFLSLAHMPLRRLIEIPPWLVLTPPDLPLTAVPLLTPDLGGPEATISIGLPYSSARPQSHLIVLIDVSASMRQRMASLQDGLRDLVARMQPGDQLSLLTYAGRSRVLVTAAGIDRRDDLLRAIAELGASGDTQLAQGLRQAYHVGRQHFIVGGNNQVVIATDGAVTLRKGWQRRVQRYAQSDDPLALSIWLTANRLPLQREMALNAWVQRGQGVLTREATTLFFSP